MKKNLASKIITQQRFSSQHNTQLQGSHCDQYRIKQDQTAREHTVKSKCNNTPRGCNFAVSLKELRDHEDSCSFRGSRPTVRTSDMFQCTYTREGCDFHIGEITKCV